MASASANHDPALSSHPASSTAQQQQSNLPNGAADLAALAASGLDPAQLVNLMNTYPFLQKLADSGGNLKEDAAQTLAVFAHQEKHEADQRQLELQRQQHQYHQQQQMMSHPYGMAPGPSSHPLGPPNLGLAQQPAPPAQQQASPVKEDEGASDGDDGNNSGGGGQASQGEGSSSTPNHPTTKRGRSAAMGSDEWSRQRKDNHKEVERRRRGNINEGINELGRIVPNGSGEKAKGAILSRAVQYIHHLKENEARNIEKWTLEKLLMDQAMGDLQAQLEEVRRLWDEERLGKQRVEAELEALRAKNSGGGEKGGTTNENGKRTNDSDEDGVNGKRQRAE